MISLVSGTIGYVPTWVERARFSAADLPLPLISLGGAFILHCLLKSTKLRY